MWVSVALRRAAERLFPLCSSSGLVVRRRAGEAKRGEHARTQRRCGGCGGGAELLGFGWSAARLGPGEELLLLLLLVIIIVIII